MNSKIRIASITMGIIIAVIISFFYLYADVLTKLVGWWCSPVENGKNYYAMRGIGTYGDLWLNGYLGIFFRFKYVGTLTWAAIPLFIHFLANIRGRRKWELGLCFVVIASCVVIGVRGYANYRYQGTVYPMLLSLVILYGWEIVRKIKPFSRKIVIVIMCMLICGNYYHFRRKFVSNIFGNLLGESPKFPSRIVEYIENIQDLACDEVILECNQPLLYYHTSKKGLNYFDRRMIKLYKKYDDVWKAADVMYNSLNVRYIFTKNRIEERLKGRRWEILNRISSECCYLVIVDHGYKLYKMKNVQSKV